MAEHPPINPPAATEPSWSQVWQLPALLVGLVLLSLGLWLLVMGPRQKNDFPGALDGIAQYLQAGQFQQANDHINAVLPHIDEGTNYDKARMAMLEGDLVYLEQATQAGTNPENDKRILADYAQARKLGMPLDTLHLQRRWAQTMVSAGEETEALKLIDEFKDQPAETRYLVLRRIIEVHRLSGADLRKIAPLLSQFLNEVSGEALPAKRRAQQLWASGLQAQLMLDADQPRNAIDYLQRQIIEFMDQGGDGDLGPLMVMLAKSFQLEDQHDKAQHWYHQAQQKIAKEDPLNAEILVGLAQIDLAQFDDFHSALEKFSTAESQYATSTTPAHFDALVGRAYCRSPVGHSRRGGAAEHFSQAIQMLLADPRSAPTRMNRLTNAIQGQHDLSFLTKASHGSGSACNISSFCPRYTHPTTNCPCSYCSIWPPRTKKLPRNHWPPPARCRPPSLTALASPTPPGPWLSKTPPSTPTGLPTSISAMPMRFPPRTTPLTA